MKKIILTNGLISGIIVSAFMVYGTLSCYNNPDFEPNMVLGYAGMLLAFIFVFIGIKQFRDKINNGAISFGKAFLVGLYISLIASTIYVAVWLVEYYVFIPDFMEKYTASLLKTAQQNGAGLTELEQQKTEMAFYSNLYKNPIGVILLSYAEILPIGLLFTLISALILKKKEKL